MLSYCYLILVSPRFTKVPNRIIAVREGSTLTVHCQAFAFPRPVIRWSKAFSPFLPRHGLTFVNGTLKISRFSLQDTGSYQCNVTNKLGSITTATTLQFQKPPGKLCHVASYIFKKLKLSSHRLNSKSNGPNLF